jgi:diguanylate cyclase (GGDEF)-like protein
MKDLVAKLRPQALLTLIGVMVCLLLAASWYYVQSEESEQLAAAQISQRIGSSAALKYQANNLARWQNAYALDVLRELPGATQDNALSRRQFLQAATVFTSGLAQLRSSGLSSESQQELNLVAEDFQRFMQTDAQLLRAYRSGDNISIARANALLVGAERERVQSIAQRIDALIDNAQNALRREQDGSVQRATFARRALLLIGASALLLTALLSITVLRSAAKNQALLTQLIDAARTDPLTKIANRRRWDERLHEEIERAKRTNESLTIAILDLDFFKHFNDTHGHPEGDRLLADAAARWSTLIRKTDLLARYGGEEFAVLMPACPVEQAMRTLDRLRSVIPFEQTASVGIASYLANESAQEFVGRADAALYAAKAAGRNRIELAKITTKAPASTNPGHLPTKSSLTQPV